MCACFTSALYSSYFYVNGRQLPQGGSDLVNQLFCRVVAIGWLPYTCMCLSTYNLMVIALDRYFSIVKPIFHLKLTKKNFFWPCIVLYLVFLGLFNLVVMFAISGVEDGHCLGYVNMLKSETIALFALGIIDVIVFYAFPLATMIYLYTHILVTLTRKQLISKSGSDIFPKAKQNLLRTMLLVTAAFVLCNTPNMVIVTNPGDLKEELLMKAFPPCSIMLWIGCCVNPVIYLASHNNFQSGVRKMLRMKPKTLCASVTLSQQVGVSSRSITKY